MKPGRALHTLLISESERRSFQAFVEAAGNGETIRRATTRERRSPATPTSFMARIVAKRLLEHLDVCGFVVMSGSRPSRNSRRSAVDLSLFALANRASNFAV